MPPAPQTCPCGTEHYNDYHLCDWCAREMREALEQRLWAGDGATEWVVVVSWAAHGQGEKKQARWWVG